MRGIDITGQKFNMLTAIRPTDKRTSKREVIWECQCECGNITYVASTKLKNGKVKSCGCLKNRPRYADITGQKFNMLTALKPIGEKAPNGSMIWECQCDCGNIVNVNANHLKTNNTKSCGCLFKEFNDLTGKRFGQLTVIERAEERIDNQITYKCQCDCGNITYVPATRLNRGKTKSCGCSKYSQIAGMKFGKLLAIEPTDKRNNKKNVIWRCKCDCGNFVEVASGSLIDGNTKSCGCIQSVGEYEIQQLLQTNNINYQKEYTFDDLKDQRRLRFDFAIFDDDNNNLQYLIEFDGEQHFETTRGSWNDLTHYKLTKLHDQMKDDYCKEHNIPLIRIPYTKRGNLTIEDLIIN